MIATVGTDPAYRFDPSKTALLVIDMQNDFCTKGGYIDQLGLDVSPTRAIIPAVASLLAAAREADLTIVHTQQGVQADLSDCEATWLFQSEAAGHRIGDSGPLGRHMVRGERGHATVDELQPLPGEIVICKPGKGAFYRTDLQEQLQARGISHLVFAGVTTDVCVHSTLREAEDRGYWNLLLEDCCAAFNQRYHEACVDMVRQSGIFGWVASSRDFMDSLGQASPSPA